MVLVVVCGFVSISAVTVTRAQALGLIAPQLPPEVGGMGRSRRASQLRRGEDPPRCSLLRAQRGDQANFFFLIFSISFDELCVFLSPTKIALISSFLSVSRSGSVLSVYSVPFA